jgi:hypothetical protein
MEFVDSFRHNYFLFCKALQTNSEIGLNKTPEVPKRMAIPDQPD